MLSDELKNYGKNQVYDNVPKRCSLFPLNLRLERTLTQFTADCVKNNSMGLPSGFCDKASVVTHQLSAGHSKRAHKSVMNDHLVSITYPKKSLMSNTTNSLRHLRRKL